MHEYNRRDPDAPTLTVDELLEFKGKDATFQEMEQQFAKGRPNNRHFWRDRRRARFPNKGGKK